MKAADLFTELSNGAFRPCYLLVGEEPFQIEEVLTQLKKHFVKEGEDSTFTYEKWDGEGLDVEGLLSSLQTLPGLFSQGESARLVVCVRFEKVSASLLEKLEPYFEDPSPTTCFVMVASKVDKRRAWFKNLEKQGSVLEFFEPADREWPRWQSYFEKRVGKKFEGKAWDIFVESSNYRLSSLSGEVEKATAFAGDAPTITEIDARALAFAQDVPDVFSFADDVILKKKAAMMLKYEKLSRSGENDVKLLAILVRQFRMLRECQRLMKQGITDPKVLAPKIGSHPFYVSKVQNQAKRYKRSELNQVIERLTEADYAIKTGQGGLFENVLMPLSESPA